MDILLAEDYDAIRAAIDISLLTDVESDAEQSLPNSVIEMDIYGVRAEAYVKSKVPTWATIVADNGAEAASLRSAVVYYTAALIAPSVPFYIRENFGDYSYTRSDADWLRHAATLRGSAEELLGGLLGDYALPTLFDVANGYRGW